jgi:trans-aconitate methyltransferase
VSGHGATGLLVRNSQSYAFLRAGRKPNPLVADAVNLLDDKHGRALDIGAGPLNNTRFLLDAGFSVDAIDTDPFFLSLASALNNRRLNAVLADIRNAWIAPDAYSLIVAIHILPFLPRADLPWIMSSIVDGLAKNGILCCTFFGVRDSWAQRGRRMIFLSRSEISPFLTGLKQIEFSELVYDGADAQNRPKHWNIFRCILRK